MNGQPADGNDGSQQHSQQCLKDVDVEKPQNLRVKSDYFPLRPIGLPIIKLQ
jgi:hypothetical protein